MFDTPRHRPEDVALSHQSALTELRLDSTVTAQIEAEYRQEKSPELDKQRGMQERLDAFKQTGAAELNQTISRSFPDFAQINSELTTAYPDFIQLSNQNPEAAATALNNIQEVILAPSKELLRGQEHKIKRAEQYTAALLNAIQNKMNSFAQIDGNESQKLKLTEQYCSVLYDAINAITFQDLTASAVLVGDHGWPHLFQDFRDGLNIARAKKGVSLDDSEVIVFGLASAYHDVGYAAPQVRAAQQESSASYSVDQGHPLLGAAYIRHNQDKLSAVLASTDLDLLHAVILYHENPEKAAIAGDKKYMMEAFAQADASAVMGIDKIPSGFSAAPEMLNIALYKAEISAIETRLQGPDANPNQVGFYRELHRRLTEEIGIVQTRMRERLSQQYPKEYVSALMNATNHISGNTLKFVGPRLVGEMNPPVIINDALVTDVFGGAAKEVSQTGAYIRADVALAQQVLKMYSEQSSSTLDPAVQQELVQLLTQPQTIEADSAISSIASFDAQTGTISLTNAAKTVVIRYNPSARSDKNPEFTNQVVQQLGQANDRISSISNEIALPLAT